MPPASTSKSSANRKGQSYAVQNRVKGNRAKSGCYTCRIRRKKCDERRIGETNSCGTCLRLNVECLGFGEKRPEWLRGPGVTQEIREKIKDHLGSQGMIKGHSGGGSKTQIQEKSLRLSEMRDVSLDAKDYPSGSSSSGSPGREYSVESEQLFMFDQLAAREYDYYGQTDMVPSGCESLTNPMIQFPYTEGLMVTAGCLDTPATRSRISTLYNAEFTIDPEPDYIFDAMNPPASIIFPSNILPDYLITDSVHTYVNNIIKIQYMLGDKVMLPEMIWEAVNQHIASKEAVSLLSQAYNQRKVDRNSFLLQDKTVQHRVLQLREMLILAETNFKADDAMAALHVVSLYLFDGGQGRWDEFLNFACSYTIKVLEDPCYGGNYIQALEGANDKDQFVIKTTIWFDVLASVTTMKPPRLLEHIRQLFHPTQAPRKYSMLSPMGCENSVVLALAETSNLAYYKAKSERQGCLSIRQLVNKVQEIEPLLLPSPLPMEPRDSPEGWSRYLTSEIFRTSTRLFLQSVESGDHPHVPEIQLCVHDTLAAILCRPPRQACMDILTTSAVIRSTVFAFYICGSLADSEQILNILQAQLTQEISDEGIGNTMTISALLTRLWDERRTQMPGQPVRWRRLLRKAEILLV